jgi:hypothetical protein
MPKQCKPTEEAINKRIDAYLRQLRIKDAFILDNIVPIEIFGIKHRIKKEGLFTIADILEELK